MNKEFLYRLLNTVSVSGNEEANQRHVLDYTRDFSDRQYVDSVGNAVAVINENAKCRVLITGHIDEIGYRVTNIDSEGFIHVQKAGGVRGKLYVGAPMQIIHEGEKVNAVGVYTSELLKKSDFSDSDLILDIGAKSKEEALKKVSVGDSVCGDTTVREMLNDFITCRALDDKAGAFTVIEAGKLAKEKGAENGIYILSAAGEETSSRGAFHGSVNIDPTCAIAVDVTWAQDYPGADPSETGDIRVGGGPVLCLSGMVNKKMNELLKQIASEKNIPLQYEVAGGGTYTDGDTIVRTNKGVPMALVSIPERYMHSSAEIVSLKDIEQCIELISEFCIRINEDFDFNPLKV